MKTTLVTSILSLQRKPCVNVASYTVYVYCWRINKDVLVCNEGGSNKVCGE